MAKRTINSVRTRGPKAIDMIGERFGHLLVVERSWEVDTKARWLCQCDCGSEITVAGTHLRSGETISCGCVRKILSSHRNSVHGMSRSTEYAIWRNIKYRCRNPKSKNYRYYGGRGIEICDEWFDSFEAFYSHMGPRPTPDHSVEREDNDGHYEPLNCKWATRSEQQLNRRGSRRPLRGSSNAILSFGA